MPLCEWMERRVLLSQTWYVATNGSNLNAGTLAAPLATIQAAANAAQPGDTVMIEGGTYHETVTPPISGTSAAPITFEAYDNQTVIISGADPISGWTQYNGSIYQAPQSWDLGLGNNQVFVDGQMLGEAQYPNYSGNISQPAFATAASASATFANSWLMPSTATISDPSLPGGANSWAGATIHIASGQGWNVQTGTVLASSAGSLTFSYIHMTGYESPAAGNKYYLTGSLNALTGPGQWYRDPNSGLLYVWMPAGDNPATHDVEVKSRQFAFELSGLSYIDIQGITLFAAGIDSNSSSSHLTINNLTAQYVTSGTSDPVPWNDHNLAQTSGILLNGTDEVLENSTIAFSAEDGVYVSGSNNLVQDCVIHDVDYAGGDWAGIEIAGSNQQVIGNTIYNAGRDGISATYSYNDQILNNTIHDVGLQTTDLGGIYVWGSNGEGTQIAGNTIYNITSGGFGADGVYLDNGSNNYIVDNNTIYNVDHPLKLNGPSWDNQVYSNNITGGSNFIVPQSPPANGSENGVTDLGTFGGFVSDADAINNVGQITGPSNTGNSTGAFLYSAGKSTNLGTLGGNYSIGMAVNDSGVVAGAAYTANGPRQAFEDSNGIMTDLGTFSGDVASEAYAINDDDQIVGESYNQGAVGRAFLDSGGQMSAIPSLGGASNAAFGINASGSIVGESAIAGNQAYHAFLDNDGTLTDLGTLGGTNSAALAVNSGGEIVGQSLVAGDGATHAFLYSNGQMIDLGTVDGLPNSVAIGINDEGDVVGYAYDNSSFVAHAFLYHGGVMYDLNTLFANTGWTFTQANGINNSGQIVGQGINPSGFSDAFEIQGPSSADTLFSANSAPTGNQQNIYDPPSTGGVELGMKFTSDVSGYVSGVRFWKGSQDTGTQTGELWTAGGQLLATATFSDETASGWQQVNFSSPVAIVANTTYVVSFHTTSPYLAYTPQVFASQVNNSPLHGLSAGAAAGNGVYAYGSSATFPTLYNGQAPSYWVDVAFAPAPMALAATPTGLAISGTTSSSVSLTWNASSGASSYTVLREGPGQSIYSAIGTSSTTSFTDNSVSAGATYSYEVEATNSAGNSLPSGPVSATTPSVSIANATLFASSSAPAANLQNVYDPPSAGGVELGLKFSSSTSGYVTGVRFWKGSLDTGVQSGDLWTSSGQLLATATFTNETSSGWQQVNFSSPVAITANTIYVVSYHSTSPYLAYAPNTLASGISNSPLQAPAGNNGVYAYGSSSTFPNQYNGQSPSYWVDVVFSTSVPNPPPPPPPPVDTIFSAATAPTSNQQNVNASGISANGGAELGVKFTSDVAGIVTGVRFWKGTLNTGVHTGELWSAGGLLLAAATFTNETASGWQQVNFSTPVTIAANTVYVVSYHTTASYIAYTPNALANFNINNGPLSALGNGVDGGDGVYAYGSSSVFPTLYNSQAPNYWVDVVFSPT